MQSYFSPSECRRPRNEIRFEKKKSKVDYNKLLDIVVLFTLHHDTAPPPAQSSISNWDFDERMFPLSCVSDGLQPGGHEQAL